MGKQLASLDELTQMSVLPLGSSLCFVHSDQRGALLFPSLHVGRIGSLESGVMRMDPTCLALQTMTLRLRFILLRNGLPFKSQEGRIAIPD